MRLLVFNIGAANQEIARLESALGIPPVIGAKKLFNISKANERIVELGQQLKDAGKPLPEDSLLHEKAKAEHTPDFGKRLDETFGDGTAARIAAKQAPVTQPAGTLWTVETLSAMIDGVFGRGTSASLCKEPIFCEVRWPATSGQSGGQSIADSAKRFEAHGTYESQRNAKEFEAALSAKDTPKARAEKESRDMGKLKSFLLESGVKVPGLSFAGTPTPSADTAYNRRESATKFHQAAIDTFAGILTGDESAGMASGTVADTARAFVASKTNQPFAIGLAITKTL